MSNPYSLKDQQKFLQCTHLIGSGVEGSSSASYLHNPKQLHDQLSTNLRTVTKYSIIGITVNGNRPNRYPIPKAVIEHFAKQCVAFVTDNDYNRNRPYNIGEREVAELLYRLGYTPTEQYHSTIWRKSHVR